MRTLVRAIGERFGGARLVFDAVGRLGRRLMRASFKSFGMQNYDECLCVDDPEALRAWCPGATLTYRGYMLGYQRMVDPAVTHLHRLLARVCDGPVKMRIFRFDFCE